MSRIISVIIPLYNQAENIGRYICSLKKQSYGFKNLEIILVNDGSGDNSDEICHKLCRKYKNIKYFCNEHSGVSAARNTGIKVAIGKYIFFLDADDQMSPNTIKDCVNVFDSIYNQVDLLTYPIETYYKGRKLEPHFRYRFLKENGVYDLTKEAFIGQTTMNIAVKNRFDNNILFDETMDFSEDQKYCCDVLHDKLKMGFCKTAAYIYNRSEESSSGRLSGACYMFETSTKMFEDIFVKYENVPVAFQGLFVNDIYWKMLENIFFPYHYNEEKYDEAMARIKALLRRCYNYVILNHPTFDFYEKFYLMRLKGENTLQVEQKKDEIVLVSEKNIVLKQTEIEMVITKVRIEGTKVRILGFLKSVFFQFYHGSVELYAVENETEKRLMELYPSAHNFYRSHEATQRFYAMEYECDITLVSCMRFELKLGQTILPVGYYIMPLVPFSKTEHVYRKDGVEIWFENRLWKFNTYETTPQQELWLYYDCQGVEIDNGLKQFIHDSIIEDGIEKVYVYTDERQLKYLPAGAKRVLFGCDKHKDLLLMADKVITAFIEDDNILPWPAYKYGEYANRLHFETIYLQHGVMHIEMPWKYSPEKILADKVVVSTDVDYGLFRKNGFKKCDLWKVGMPRFDELSLAPARKKKILYAPSWRSYLVTSNNGHGWKILANKYKASKYSYGLKIFLESKELEKILKDYGFVLEVKLHPIFMSMNSEFLYKSEVVKIVEQVNEEEYSLFITDFSSYLFDFLYMRTPFLSYIPDFEEFACGMNGYRKVDFMNKVDYSKICITHEQTVAAIDKFLKSGESMDYSVEFYNTGTPSMDKIYELCVNN